MPKKIAVHLFRVNEQSGSEFINAIEAVHSLPIPMRWSTVGIHEMKLDCISRAGGRNGVILLDFVKKREVGPGKVSATTSVQSIGLSEEEHFGEETAALYDIERGWLAIQYNQHGVRSGAIEHYLQRFHNRAEDPWSLDVYLDPSVRARYDIRTNIQSATITARMTREVRGALEDDGGTLAGTLSAMEEESAATTISITLSRRRNQGAMNGTVRGLLNSFSQLGKDQGVSTLEVRAHAPGEEKDDVINLLKHRVKDAIDCATLAVDGKRYTQDSRFDALVRINRQWRHQFR